MKALIGDTVFLRLLVSTGQLFYVVIRATRRSSHLQGKGSTFGPVPGIELATSRSAVERSADWASPAAVERNIFIFIRTFF